MPVAPDIDDDGPTRAQRGSGALRHIVSKSPNLMVGYSIVKTGALFWSQDPDDGSVSTTTDRVPSRPRTPSSSVQGHGYWMKRKYAPEAVESQRCQSDAVFTQGADSGAVGFKITGCARPDRSAGRLFFRYCFWTSADLYLGHSTSPMRLVYFPT